MRYLHLTGPARFDHRLAIIILLFRLCGVKGAELRERAEQGDAEAQFQMGNQARSSDEAAVWVLRAANQGYPEAAFEVASWYLEGAIGETNSAQGYRYAHQAAEAGSVSGQNLLGLCYLRGIGTATNFEQAVFWFSKAAKKGLADAQYRLAIRYSRGEGTKQSFKESFQWLMRAAKQGHTDAQIALGDRYVKGEGTKVDYLQAYKWATIVEYESRIKWLTGKLKPEEVKVARAEAEKFKPRLEYDPNAPPESHMLEWVLAFAALVSLAVSSIFFVKKRGKVAA